MRYALRNFIWHVRHHVAWPMFKDRMKRKWWPKQYEADRVAKVMKPRQDYNRFLAEDQAYYRNLEIIERSAPVTHLVVQRS